MFSVCGFENVFFYSLKGFLIIEIFVLFIKTEDSDGIENGFKLKGLFETEDD